MATGAAADAAVEPRAGVKPRLGLGVAASAAADAAVEPHRGAEPRLDLGVAAYMNSMVGVRVSGCRRC